MRQVEEFEIRAAGVRTETTACVFCNICLVNAINRIWSNSIRARRLGEKRRLRKLVIQSVLHIDSVMELIAKSNAICLLLLLSSTCFERPEAQSATNYNETICETTCCARQQLQTEQLVNVVTELLQQQIQAKLQQEAAPPNCAAVKYGGHTTSGKYTIFVGRTMRPVDVFCDMTTTGGGWTVIQRRNTDFPPEEFNRSWSEYETGFGDLHGEFWLGNRNIHLLTNTDAQTYRYVLRIELVAFNGSSGYAEFSNFRIGPAYSNYPLDSLGNYSGTVGSRILELLIGVPFSTPDRDNDDAPDLSCATLWGTFGWWYSSMSCQGANLNGKPQPNVNWRGITWLTWLDSPASLKGAEMKIRPLYAYK